MLNTMSAMHGAILYFGSLLLPIRGLLICGGASAASTLFHTRLSEDALWTCLAVDALVAGGVVAYAIRQKQKTE